MSNLEDHEREQAVITAAWEAKHAPIRIDFERHTGRG